MIKKAAQKSHDSNAGRSLWKRCLPFVVPAAIGFVAALIFAGGLASFVQYSNSLGFCANSCHEMQSTVYQEYKKSVHFTSRTGVHPVCSNCHVPHGNWLKTLIYKAGATKELFHHFAGTVNTTEKFEAKRLELAENVWREMKANDSENCRSCHKVENWDLSLQKPRARGQHEDMVKTGQTCIDCHKGIAHKAVHEKQEEEDSFTLDGEEESFELQ